jgi:DNA polymerase III subunit alpha
MFAPLHVRSDRSPGDGTASVLELVRRAAAQGFPALALTDVENLYGQVEFHHAARAHGVRAITGVELRAGYGPRTVGERRGRLILLARDRAGYVSLCRVVTRRRAAARGERTGDPLECLADAPRGVWFLSDDRDVIDRLLIAGVPPAELLLLVAQGGGRGGPGGVAAVADPEVVLLDPDDHALHRLQLAIRRRLPFTTVIDAAPARQAFPTAEDVLARWSESPDLIAATLRVAERCTLDLTAAPPARPSLADGDPAADDAALEQAARAALAEGRRHGRWMEPERDARITRELETFRVLGLAGYVRIVAAIAERARAAGIAIAGRGSVAGSLVAHVLGITPIDPVAHGLMFERFAHAGRRGLPDIDLDVPSERREELIEWTVRRFGRERVAMVSAHQTFRRRGAYRDGLRAFGLGEPAVERFMREFPPDDIAAELGLPAPIAALPEPLRAMAPLIERLIGRLHGIAVHPGGVAIADPRLVDHTALERAPRGVIVTQYDMHALDRLGVLKVDLLGNRALSAIEAARAALPHAEPIPERDEATAAALREARTVGCFQIETGAVRSMLRQAAPGDPDALANALALVRPGPGSGEAKAAYVRRARGLEAAEPPHPRLAPVLARTLGVPIFEEDVIASIAALTGFTLERADTMREAIVAAAERRDLLEPVERTFVAAARDLAPAEAAALWRGFERFAAYAFNRAHAVSYARLAWESLYLKVHHPAAFAAALLDRYGGGYPLRTIAAEFARAGVRLLAPDVTRSAETCALEGEAVRIGLAALGHVTGRTRARILAGRPFADVDDLVGRVPLRRAEIESLVLSGACDALAPLDPSRYPFAHEALVARLTGRPAPRQPVHAPRADDAALDSDVVTLYRRLVRAWNELRFLGMHPSDHPMRLLRDEATRTGCSTVAALDALDGGPVRIAGVVAASRRTATRGGRLMQYVTIEDESGLIETVLLPGRYLALGDLVRSPGPYIVAGRLERTYGDGQVIVGQVTPFHARPHPFERSAHPR